MIRCDWCDKQMRVGESMSSITRVNQGMSMGPDMTQELCYECDNLITQLTGAVMKQVDTEDYSGTLARVHRIRESILKFLLKGGD